MNQRFNIQELQPKAYDAMLGLEQYLSTTTIDRRQKYLIKIRASQINGCAYCIQMHALEAKKLGETELRIYALSAWKESPLFTEEERTVLAITEEVTLIGNNGLSENTYQQAKKFFDENMIAQLVMHITVINAWNRIAISARTSHPVEN